MSNNEEIRLKFLHMYDRSMHFGDYGPTEELCSVAFACTNPNYEIDGISGIKNSIDSQRNAFEDFHMEIDFSFASDDGVGLSWRLTGRHVNEIYGVPPSGKRIEAQGLSIHELADGKSIGGWSAGNVLEKLREAYAEAEAEGSLPSAG